MKSPNTTFQDALNHNISEKSQKAFSYILGVSQSEEVVYTNLSNTPHLVIAGTTGTGKSTLAHAILLSLLKSTSPDKLSILLCDTKMIEFSYYQNAPHLIAPVLTDSERIQGAVMWANSELARRLRLISTAGYRSFETYNSHLVESGKDELPRILLIIDDVVSALYDRKSWDSLHSIAQSGRTVGLHLILVTQMPSDKRIASIIRSSISARAVFNVFSNTDENLLLGSSKNAFLSDVGEIIFCTMPSRSKQKIRCYPITDTDISTVLAAAKDQYPDASHQFSVNITPISILPYESEDVLDGDELLPDAVDIILETGQASVSMLQRRLALGYARAARLLDEMEEKGLVGPFLGSCPREILITKAQWDALKNGQRPENLAVPNDGDSVEEQDELDTLSMQDTLKEQTIFDAASIPTIADVSRPKQKKRSWFSTFRDLLTKNKGAETVHDTISETLVTTTNSQLVTFEQEHPLLDEIHTKVVGVTFPNDDGSSRQRILSLCHCGDEVIFHPFKYEGDPALAVHTRHGQIGNLSANLAARFEYDYECDLILSGVITEITGGTDGRYYGCNLLIKAYKA